MADRVLGSRFTDENTRTVPLVQLYPMANKVLHLEPMIRSIREHGMEFPLFCSGPNGQEEAIPRRAVLRTYTLETYDRDVVMLGVPGDEDDYWAVQVGNQRYLAALAMGYTHIAASLWPLPKNACRNDLALKCRGTRWLKPGWRKAGYRMLGDD